MIDTFQKIFLAGLGATATTAEAVKKTLDELVEKGKITRDEAKEYADKMLADGRKEFEDARTEANTFFKSMMHRFNVATQDDLAELQKDIRSLKGRVTKLEKADD